MVNRGMTLAEQRDYERWLMERGIARRRAWSLAVLGGALSLTGVGAVIGVPLALAGLAWRANQVVQEESARVAEMQQERQR